MNSEETTRIKQQVYVYLKERQIRFKKYEHEPIYTVEAAKKMSVTIEGQECKNLFLRDRSGKTHYLVILPQEQQIHLKEIEAMLNLNKLSFASPDRLMKYLGVTPGAVGAFGLINDLERKVVVIVSNQFDVQQDITFHPNVNDETLQISFSDLVRFMGYTGHEIVFF